MVKILMCGSALTVKGGMVSVAKNYLQYPYWKGYQLSYIPTHKEINKYLLVLYFGMRYMQIVWLALFGNYKIVHLHIAERGSFYRKAILALTLKSIGKKVILHHHHAEFEEFYDSLSARKKNFVKTVFERVDLNIVLGTYFIPLIIDKAPKARVKVLHNAVVTYPQNQYNKEARNILFLGKLCKRKGIYDLLACIKELDSKMDADIRFFLCGNGDIEDVKNRIRALNISHRIAHIGWCNEEERMVFMSKSMLHVLPSYNEGLPMSILETMAYGIPTVSTHVAAIPEMLHDGENGFLVNPGDVTDLSNKLYQLITDKELREKFSENAYQVSISAYSLDKHIRDLIDIYNSL